MEHTEKLYKLIAQKLNWNPPTQEFIDQRRLELNTIELIWLPSGSGIDAGSTIDRDSIKKNSFVISAGYHYMNEHGYYDGWFYFEIKISASLQYDYDIEFKITSNDTSQTKVYLKTWCEDYILDTFQSCLDQEISLEKLHDYVK